MTGCRERVFFVDGRTEIARMEITLTGRQQRKGRIVRDHIKYNILIIKLKNCVAARIEPSSASTTSQPACGRCIQDEASESAQR